MTDISDRLRSGLAGRYTLEREPGRGGMAVVYLAHDLRHLRPTFAPLRGNAALRASGGRRLTADLRARLQAVLAEEYALEREFGGGGMARVFVATAGIIYAIRAGGVLSPLRTFPRIFQLADGATHRFARVPGGCHD